MNTGNVNILTEGVLHVLTATEGQPVFRNFSHQRLGPSPYTPWRVSIYSRILNQG
jgi:hypothetical protein